jgi:5'-nucleotidase
MNILLSNDDGYNAKGIKILEKILMKYGSVTIAAPYKNVSACSSSLTVHSKIEIKKINKKCYAIKGTIADSIHILTRGILKKKPDIVISGINFGSNMGDDVIYSGTVAGAIEGRLYKHSPIAISIANRKPLYINDLEDKLELFLPMILKETVKLKTIFNINIPDVPFGKIKGVKVTKLGRRNISKRAKIDNINHKIYATIGAVGNPIPSNSFTDFNAVEHNYISITPLNTDMSDYEIISKLKKI